MQQYETDFVFKRAVYFKSRSFEQLHRSPLMYPYLYLNKPTREISYYPLVFVWLLVCSFLVCLYFASVCGKSLYGKGLSVKLSSCLYQDM